MRLAAQKNGCIRQKIFKTFAKYTDIILNMKQSMPEGYESQKELR
jgi:hypothetical protein